MRCFYQVLFFLLVGAHGFSPSALSAGKHFDLYCNMLARQTNSIRFEQALQKSLFGTPSDIVKSTYLYNFRTIKGYKIQSRDELYNAVFDLTALRDPTWTLADVEKTMAEITRYVLESKRLDLSVRNLRGHVQSLTNKTFLGAVLPYIQPSKYADMVAAVDHKIEKNSEKQHRVQRRSSYMVSLNSYLKSLPPKSAALETIRDLAAYARRGPTLLQSGEVKDKLLVDQIKKIWGLDLHPKVVTDALSVTTNHDEVRFCGHCNGVEKTLGAALWDMKKYVTTIKLGGEKIGLVKKLGGASILFLKNIVNSKGEVVFYAGTIAEPTEYFHDKTKGVDILELGKLSQSELAFLPMRTLAVPSHFGDCTGECYANYIANIRSRLP